MRGALLWILGLGVGGWQIASAQPEDLQLIWHTTGSNPNSGLGWQLVSAGDINGDGYDDILASTWDTRVVYLYFGGNPMDTIPDFEFSVPRDYSNATLPNECRDLNADGFPDFTIKGDSLGYNSLYLFFGGPDMNTLPDLIFHCDFTGSSQNFYGDYVSMGDFNGDGNYDLVVANGNYSPPVDYGHGKIYVYYGGPDIDNITDWTITGYYNNFNWIGGYLSCGGDVNNDGYDDIFCRGTALGQSEGIVMFHGGNPADTLVDWEIQSNYYFLQGGYLPTIPDMNGDNCDELVNGTGNYANVFFGGDTINTYPDVQLRGSASYNVSSLGSIGDIDNDGWNDFALINGNTELNIFFLSPSAIGNVNPQISFQVSNLGRVKFAGDVMGIGRDNFMIAKAGNNNTGEILIYSYNNSGVAYDQEISIHPASISLSPCYPNPFNSQTTIPFELNLKNEISLCVYDVLGRKVSQLLYEKMTPGNYQAIWNAEKFPSGTYFINLSDGRNSDTKTV